LRLVSIIPALADPHQQPLAQTGRLTLRVAGTVLTLYLNDTVAGGDFAAQAQQALTALDGDKNGYLEKSEVPDNAAPQLGQFDAVDTDEDGKVYPAEIITFLQQQQAGLRAQIHLKASDREDALFAALDQNNDERLDAFEVEQVPEQLALLDASGDGWLTRDEVPESLVIGLARGSLENMDALFTLPPLFVRPPAEGTPRWFTAMDANGDGAISQREFIGSLEAFARLDTSGDALVDAVEAKAAE
jgi:Ca2+-binding EF-hand superfamily protein